jgi:hypothetical protein
VEPTENERAPVQQPTLSVSANTSAITTTPSFTSRGEMERLNQLALRVVPPPELTSTARPSPSATTVVVEEVAAA